MQNLSCTETCNSEEREGSACWVPSCWAHS